MGLDSLIVKELHSSTHEIHEVTNSMTYDAQWFDDTLNYQINHSDILIFKVHSNSVLPYTRIPRP